jgi:NitT/TauT family transport system permease protein
MPPRKGNRQLVEAAFGGNPGPAEAIADWQAERVELAGLDALEQEPSGVRSRPRRAWSALWPKVAAIAIAIFLWQVVVWTGWRDEVILPAPPTVFEELWRLVQTATFWEALGNTMQRALWGFFLALVIGTVVGAAVARIPVLRVAVGSLITGLQTMPSIVWFPLAIVLFALSEGAIIFVVVLGAAPSIANGLIGGVDHVPPLLLRAGRTLGARGFTLFRSVILPSAMPTYINGLKQGWAFAWRSLMAGELLVAIANKPVLGQRLDFARTLSDYPLLISYMIVILVIGIIVDSVFGVIERRVRSKRGLLVG